MSRFRLNIGRSHNVAYVKKMSIIHNMNKARTDLQKATAFHCETLSLLKVEKFERIDSLLDVYCIAVRLMLRILNYEISLPFYYLLFKNKSVKIHKNENILQPLICKNHDYLIGKSHE